MKLKAKTILGILCASVFMTGGAMSEDKVDMPAKMSEVMGDWATMLESIKDDDSGKKAIDSMDAITEKYAAAVKAAASGDAVSKPEDVTKMAEEMKGIQERMTKASMTAMQVFAKNPELMQKYTEKAQAFAKAAMGAAGQ